MAKKPVLKLVSSFSAKTHPHQYTIYLGSDLEDDAHLDLAYVGAVRLYVSQKMQELEIEDHRVFVQDDQMDIFFTNTADRDEFQAAFEDRVNQTIRLKLATPSLKRLHQLENFARELTGLAWQFGVGDDVRFEVARGDDKISMIAANRDAFVTFFQEYEHERFRMPLSKYVDPESIPHLLL